MLFLLLRGNSHRIVHGRCALIVYRLLVHGLYVCTAVVYERLQFVLYGFGLRAKDIPRTIRVDR